MSIKSAHFTSCWKKIYKKCKNCHKAIYIVENNNVYYQCSLYGSFKKDCNIQSINIRLKSPKDLNIIK